MTTDEMINFDISNFVTQIAKEADLKIVNGVYTISQEYELEFNKEEIKKLLLMFKPMQKELATYKKALGHACTRLEGYDLIFDREYGCYASKWNRKRWELWAIDKAEEDLKNE